jgi:hypothetical protein
MPDLSVEHDVRILKSTSLGWSAARDATSGTVTSGGTRDFLGIYASHTAGRFGGTSARVYRYFFRFDTSGISVTPTNATLKIHGNGSTTGDLIAVKSTQGDSPSSTDFDAITGWSSGVDNESNVTKYSAEISTWSNSGFNDIALNSTGLSDMASLSNFKLCLINFDYDLKNVDPYTGSHGNGLYLSEWSDSAFHPYLTYTAGAAGYGNKVFGVAAGSIGKINGVATANVGKVNGS